MKKNTLHKFLNPVLAVLAVNQAVTAIFNDELSRGTFEILHQWAGALFLTLIAVHFFLNFNWVKANYFAK